MSDQVLEAGTAAVVARCEARGQLHDEQAELLIADINSVAIKVGYFTRKLEAATAFSIIFVLQKHMNVNVFRRMTLL